MTATMISNGRPRKQLSDQLDRLDAQMDRQDSILDALAEGLNQAVGDAARVGVKDAVQAAVIELLTNIELRSALHKATAPPADTKPTIWQKIKARAQQFLEKVRQGAITVRNVIAGKVANVKAAARTAATPAWLAWRLRKAALECLGIGLVVAAVSYGASHGLAAAVSGLFAATTAMGIQVGLWVRKTVRRLIAV